MVTVLFFSLFEILLLLLIIKVWGRGSGMEGDTSRAFSKTLTLSQPSGGFPFEHVTVVRFLVRLHIWAKEVVPILCRNNMLDY